MSNAKTSDQSNSSTTARAAKAAHETVDRAAEAAEQAEERLRQSTEEVQARAGDVMKSAESFVRERPMTSLGIAFLAGIVASSLLRR